MSHFIWRPPPPLAVYCMIIAQHMLCDWMCTLTEHKLTIPGLSPGGQCSTDLTNRAPILFTHNTITGCTFRYLLLLTMEKWLVQICQKQNDNKTIWKIRQQKKCHGYSIEMKIYIYIYIFKVNAGWLQLTESSDLQHPPWDKDPRYGCHDSGVTATTEQGRRARMSRTCSGNSAKQIPRLIPLSSANNQPIVRSSRSLFKFKLLKKKKRIEEFKLHKLLIY